VIQEDLLLTPGPVQVPDSVRKAISRPMINHRGPEFKELFLEVTRGLKWLLNTENEIVIFPSSGTGVMESAITNLFSPGDAVLVGVMGEFGRRFADIASAFGLRVDLLEVPIGYAITPVILNDYLEQAISQLRNKSTLTSAPPPYKAILLTHNETSTGAILDLKGVAAVAREYQIPIIVDAISSCGGVEIDVGSWNIDVLLTASQKALMNPPGLGIAAVSERALSMCREATLPRYYWDYRRFIEKSRSQETPYTPCIPIWFGLKEVLAEMQKEGKACLFARHRELALTLRQGLSEIGFEPFAKEPFASPTVTAVVPPNPYRADDIRKTLRVSYGIVTAGGQGPLKGKVFRVAHMGAIRPSHIERLLGALKGLLST
jgi:aspartate aminotransferase-like enzyme